MEIPSFGQIIVMSIFSICFALFCGLSIKPPHPISPFFFLSELIRQSSIIFVLVQIIAFGYLKFDFLPNNHILILIPIISIVSYILSITMGYSQSTQCKKSKKGVIFAYSLIPIIGIISGYFLSTHIDILNQGFYDILNNGNKSEFGLWTARSFWMAIFLTLLFTSLSILMMQSGKKIKQ